MAGLAVLDEPLRVTITPSQAFYFAGEPFTVSITITNIRTPQPHASSFSRSASQAYSHKRAAHSVSYVPMARPPTSPGTRVATPSLPSLGKEKGGRHDLVRRGLIGVIKPSREAESSMEAEGGMEAKRRIGLNKSLSVSISATELGVSTSEDVKGKSPVYALRMQDSVYSSPTSPRVSSPLARSSTVPPNHPHARKQSLADGSLQQLNELPLRQLPNSATSSVCSSSSSLTSTPNPSSSTFSLSLDPIQESSSPGIPLTPSFPSPHADNINGHIRTQIPTINVSSSINRIVATHNGNISQRPSALGLGPPPYPQSHKGFTASRTASVSSFPHTTPELVLYAYAQLAGSFQLVPLPGSSSSQEQKHMLSNLRNKLVRGKAVGGGSMDIALGSPTAVAFGAVPLSSSNVLGARRGHARSASLGAGLLSLLSPNPLSPSSPSQPISPVQNGWTPGHRSRQSSMFSGIFSPSTIDPLSPTTPASVPSAGVSGIDVGMNGEDIDPEAPLPTIEMRPTMLAVDLSLGPGESRSYNYTATLPKNLPPSYRGRTLRFSYEFIVGICRATPSIGSSGPSSSRVMKVPIRVYNHVVVGSPPTPYDLLWPVHSRDAKRELHRTADEIMQPTVTESIPTDSSQSARYVSYISNNVSKGLQKLDGLVDVQNYGRSLVSSGLISARDGPEWVQSTPWKHSIPASLNQGQYLSLEKGEDEDLPKNCREAVEMLTRYPKKVSYDVAREGVKIAVLTFTKAAYRLGESVLGVVEVNVKQSRARVLKMSAYLEAHESLPRTLATPDPSNTKQLRRVHAEYYASFMASTVRASFSLDIPSDASPAFQLSIPTCDLPESLGGLEWKVRLCLLVSVATPSARDGPGNVRLKQLVQDGPRGEWGTTWRAADTLAPSEYPDYKTPSAPKVLAEQQSWSAYFGSFLGAYAATPETDWNSKYDGGELSEEDEDFMGRDDEWKEIRVEMVECEVPIRVWPGNTAFKATEVMFDV